MKPSISNVHEIAVSCRREEINKNQIPSDKIIYNKFINETIDLKKSYFPLQIKNSVMNVA